MLNARPSAISLLAVAMALSVAPAAHAEREAKISPYLGVDQTVIADLDGGDGDTISYTSVTVGVDAHLKGRRAEVQANLAYQHQFSWNEGQPDQDVVTGLVTARADVMPGALSIEGGALATRVRSDAYSGGNGSLAVPSSTSDVYSLYAGPTFTSSADDLDINAAYRLGYNRLEGGFDTALAGLPQVDSFDESWNHVATASVGMQPDTLLPVGWALGAGYEREDASQLDQRYENLWGRLDLTYPIRNDLAVVGGVGYESIEISNRDAVRDPVTGDPIRDGSGRFVTDDGSPRLLAYDDAEIIWDVGLLWRPSRRTSAEFHVGHRYGSMSYTGAFNWRPDDRTAINVSLFDSVDSFGRALSGSLANLPSTYVIARNPFSGDIDSCATGSEGGACFNDALSGIRTANYRNRGISASYSYLAGPWSYGLGVGYSRRKFIANDALFAEVDGATDEFYFVNGSVSYAIDSVSALSGNLYVNRFNSGIGAFGDVSNLGGYLSYNRRIARKLEGTASLGIDQAKAEGVESVLTALAQIGMRYRF